METVERRLAAVLEKERRDAIGYTVLTVLATPLFVAMAALVVMMATAYVFHLQGVQIPNATAFYTATSAFLAYMIVFVLINAHRSRDQFEFEPVWIAGVALFLVVLAATYATPLPQVYPVGFALAYIVTGLLVLGLIGQVELPADVAQMPQKGEHFLLALILAVSGFIVTAYGQIARSSWLWAPAKPDEVRLGAWLLCKLADDPDGTMSGDAVKGRIVDILVRLKLIGVTEAGAALTHKGLEFMRAAADPVDGCSRRKGTS